jgi:hypothetical protein
MRDSSAICERLAKNLSAAGFMLHRRDVQRRVVSVLKHRERCRYAKLTAAFSRSTVVILRTAFFFMAFAVFAEVFFRFRKGMYHSHPMACRSKRTYSRDPMLTDWAKIVDEFRQNNAVVDFSVHPHLGCGIFHA